MITTSEGSPKKRAEYLGPEIRRPMIVDTALEAFSAYGFGSASMMSIADRAGVVKAVLYHCFPGGKQEMFRAVIDRCFESCLDQAVHLRNEEPAVLMRRLIFHVSSDRMSWSMLFLPSAAAPAQLERYRGGRRDLLVSEIVSVLQRGRAGETPRTARAMVLASVGLVAAAEDLGIGAADMEALVGGLLGAEMSLAAAS